MSYGRESRFGGGGRFGGGSSRGFGGPKPVETGKEYEVQVTEISRQGDGIARVQGFVIFVKGGRVGQKARVRITNVGARFATGEVVTGSPAAESSQPAQQSQESAPQRTAEEKPDLQENKSDAPSREEPPAG